MNEVSGRRTERRNGTPGETEVDAVRTVRLTLPLLVSEPRRYHFILTHSGPSLTLWTGSATRIDNERRRRDMEGTRIGERRADRDTTHQARRYLKNAGHVVNFLSVLGLNDNIAG